jgi:hypothetical protein
MITPNTLATISPDRVHRVRGLQGTASRFLWKIVSTVDVVDTDTNVLWTTVRERRSLFP